MTKITRADRCGDGRGTASGDPRVLAPSVYSAERCGPLTHVCITGEPTTASTLDVLDGVTRVRLPEARARETRDLSWSGSGMTGLAG
jgi:hypothetical protein